MLLHIRELLNEKWMYQSELALAVGVSKYTISKIVNGHEFPKEEIVRGIAKALDVPVWRLFVSPDEDVPIMGEDSRYHCPHCGGAIKIAISTDA